MMYIHVISYFNLTIINYKKKTYESSCGSSLEFVLSDWGLDPLGMAVGGSESRLPFEKRLKDKLRLDLEERLDALIRRILKERGLEPHSRNPLPSGSNSSSVEGYAHGSFSMLHTHLYLFTLMLSIILQ